jgi:hypothetical protein
LFYFDFEYGPQHDNDNQDLSLLCISERVRQLLEEEKGGGGGVGGDEH